MCGKYGNCYVPEFGVSNQVGIKNYPLTRCYLKRKEIRASCQTVQMRFRRLRLFAYFNYVFRILCCCIVLRCELLKFLLLFNKVFISRVSNGYGARFDNIDYDSRM